jgi:uncharacterized protein (DUF2147 family)
MRVCGYSLTSVAFAALTALAIPANAQSTDPTGVWLDHTGRGAIEITPCGDALCGRLVWTKDSSSKEACGVQILGEVKSSGSGVWDKGWIFDPEENSKYSVELKPLAGDKLRVVGYLGTKLFSETMTWTRAPADLQRCDATEQTAATAPATPPAAAPQSAETTVPQGDSKAAEAVPPKEPVPPAAAEPAPQKKPSRQANARPQNCKVDTPWVTVQFPCPD